MDLLDCGGFSDRCPLLEDEVHLWRTTLDVVAPGFAKLWQILSHDERERANRFRFEVDRQRTVIGRGYLRLLLGQILNVPAKELQFEYNRFGKPCLMSRQKLPLQFNVSHSGDVVLIAITRG